MPPLVSDTTARARLAAPILALGVKDLRLLFRVKARLFFTLVWPLLIAILLGAIVGWGPREMRFSIAIVDEDGTSESRAFATHLAARPGLAAAHVTRDEALDLVRRGRRIAAVILARGFGEARGRLMSGGQTRVELAIDPSRKAEASILQGILLEQGAEPFRQMMASLAGGAADQRWEPLHVVMRGVSRDERRPQSGFDITFVQGMIWGLMGCAMTFAVGLVAERTHGTFVRLQMAPLTAAQVLAGKALACFATLILLQLMLVIVGALFFGLRVASPWLLTIAMLCTASAFVGVMMLVASLGRSEEAAGGAGWAIMMPIAMLGGAMIPLIAMPAWMVTVSHASPIKWAVLALEGAVWRGFGPAEMLAPCAILLSVGLVTFGLGARLLR